MPRRIKLWIDPFAALLRLRDFLASRGRATGAKLTSWLGDLRRVGRKKPRASERDPRRDKPVLDLLPMDLRNPPSENIGSVALPLAATAAATAAGMYLVAAWQAQEAHAGVGAERVSAPGYDATPMTVPAVTLDAGAVGRGASERLDDQIDPPLQPRGASADDAVDPAVTAIDGAGSTLHSAEDGGFIPAGSGGGGGGDGDGPTTGGAGAGGGGGGGGGGDAADGLPPAPFGGVWGGSSAASANPPLSAPAGDSNLLLANPAGAGSPGATAAGAAGTTVTPTAPSETTDTASAGPTSPSPGSGPAGGDAGAAPARKSDQPVLSYSSSAQPVRFVANAGQWAPGVDFVARGEGYQAAVAAGSVTVALARPASAEERERLGTEVVYDPVRLEWAGVNPGARAQGEGQYRSVSNFLIGSDPSRWRTHVAEYSAVRYSGAWDGVDLLYHQSATGRNLEYDLVVRPGASAEAIGFDVRGADARVDEEGRLVLTTRTGAELVQSAPALYQAAPDGRREVVSGAYRLRADGSVGFTVGDYDRGRELVIDPVLNYYTTLSGSSSESATGIATGASGVAFVSGWTESSNFPTTSGVLDTTLGGTRDAFVTKLDSSGAVAWSTYLGGTLDPLSGPGNDQANAVALDSSGRPVVAGTTSSADFPATAGAYRTSLAGSVGQDAFLAKLSADGTTLVFATYLGGGGSDYGRGVAVDASNNQVVVVGQTGSSNFPTASAYDSSLGGFQDAFVTRFNSTGTGLVFSTYLGGTSGIDLIETAYAVAVDSSGNAYVGGTTGSSDFPAASAYDSSLGGSQDAFVSKFSSSGSLSNSTFLGGTGGAIEEARGVAVDSSNNVYVTGYTTATDFPTVNAAQGSFGGSQDAFLTKFTSLASTPAYSTYLGGSGTEYGFGVAVDSTGRAVVVGSSGGGLAVTRYSSSGSAVDWSTSAVSGTGYAAAVDSDDHVYAAGSGGTHALVLKYGPISAPVITTFADDTGASNSDRYTYDTTPTLTGTANPLVSVTLYEQYATDALPSVLGTVSSDAGGLWTYTQFSALSPDGRYELTAVASSGIEVSAPSAPLTFVLDTTAPDVSIAVPTQTYDTRPDVVVRASDLWGFASPATVTLDVDYNGDGIFSGGEVGAAATALTNGRAVFDSYSPLTVGLTAHFRARVTDLAGNEGSATEAVQVLTPSPTDGDLTPRDRSAYAGLAAWGADNLRATGDVTAAQGLDFDRSPSSIRGANPYLVYNSQEANPAPVVQALVQRSGALGMPTAVTGTLTWDGAAVGTVSYDLTRISAGAEWVFGAAPAANQSTGRHTYTLDLFLDYTGTANDVALADTGYTFVVNRSNSPYGAGWALSDTDALVTVASSGSYPAGVLRAFGTGGWGFYTDTGGGTYTSPHGDAGTLSGSGGAWTYTDWDGEVLSFDTSGRQTRWASPDGADVVTYAYSGTGKGTAAAVSTVASSDGGVATFAYSSGLISSISAPGSRTTSFTVTGTDLTAVTDAAGGSHTFGYSSHDLTGDTYGLVTTAYTYSGGLAHTVQTGTDASSTVTPSASAGVGTAAKAVDHNAPGSFVDARGYGFASWNNGYGQLMRTLAPDGGIEKYTRDANGWVTSYTDPLNQTTTFTVNTRGQVTLTTRPDLSSASATYGGANGSRTAWTDFRANGWTQTNDSYGRVLSVTDPQLHTTSYAYSSGRILTVTDALGNVTTSLYDANRRQTGALLGGAVTGTYGYDAAGNVGTFTDALGNITTYTNDGVGRVTSVTDPLGHSRSTAYDASGLVLSETNGAGETTSYGYDGTGRQTSRIDAYGTGSARTTNSVYDGVGDLIASVDGLGHRTTGVFDAVRRQVASVDALGNRGTSIFDLDGRVTAAMDARGRVTKYGYDSLNRQVKVTDALGNVWTTVYDADSHVTGSIDPLGHTTSATFDSVGRQISSSNGVGNTTNYGFDAAGRQVTTTDALGNVTSAVYDTRNRVQASVDARGNRTTSNYDAADRLIESVDALGNVSSTVYDAAGRAIAQIDALGHRTSTIYDNADRVIGTVDARGFMGTTNYDALGRTVSYTDALGHTRTTVYDAADRVVARTDALGNTVTSVYDDANRKTAGVDALGNRASSVYDSVGNVIATVDALGNRTSFAVDGLNRVAQTTDPLGRVTKSVFDNAGRQTASIDGSGNRTSSVYDDANRLIATVDALNHRSTTNYDAAGRVQTQKDALGAVTSYGYDGAGNRTSLTDPAGNTTTWAYDALNRVKGSTDPTGARSTVAYDNAGRMSSQTDRLGRRRDFGYDNDGRKTSEVWVTSGTAVQTQTWDYDAAGRLTSAADPDGTYTLSYDSADRVTQVQEPFGLVLTFGYDRAGNRTSVQDSKGGTSTLTFDALNRQLTEELGGSGITGVKQTRAYDPAGQLASETRQTVISSVWTVAGTTTYDYDSSGRETLITHKNGAGSTLATYAYAYDAADRLTSETVNGSQRTYTYDNTNQLTGDAGTAYTYDSNGNRNMAGYSTGTANRMTTDGTWTYTYDAEGNVTKMSKGAPSDTWVYGYDHRDQMTTAAFSATDGGTVTQRVTYVYDAFGNKIERDYWDGTTATVERYGVDGWDPAKPTPQGIENFDIWVDMNGSNVLTMRRVFGVGFDELTAREDSSGTVGWYLTDHLGSVGGVTDGAGVPLTTITYSGWGVVLSNSTAAQSDRYLFTGAQTDGATGLREHHVRFTNGTVWFSEDPKGFNAGDQNLYRYARNGPTNATDPSGLQKQGPLTAPLQELGTYALFPPRPGVPQSMGLPYTLDPFAQVSDKAPQTKPLDKKFVKELETAWDRSGHNTRKPVEQGRAYYLSPGIIPFPYSLENMPEGVDKMKVPYPLGLDDLRLGSYHTHPSQSLAIGPNLGTAPSGADIAHVLYNHRLYGESWGYVMAGNVIWYYEIRDPSVAKAVYRLGKEQGQRFALVMNRLTQRILNDLTRDDRYEWVREGGVLKRVKLPPIPEVDASVLALKEVLSGTGVVLYSAYKRDGKWPETMQLEFDGRAGKLAPYLQEILDGKKK